MQTKVLLQSVKRNAEQFPADFMFQLSAEEFAHLKSQTVTSNPARGGRRYAPYAFTEQGVAMLSSVLNSPRAIAINIEIMRAFVQVRALARAYQDVARQLQQLQDKIEQLAMQHDMFASNTRVQLKRFFETLRELMTPVSLPEPPKRSIGFMEPQEKPGKPRAVKGTAKK